jgi:putative redox protein
MTDDTLRSVQVRRQELGRYVVQNVRGGEITIGEGQNDDFTPVELLLAAIGGCTGLDVDYITSRRAQPDTFAITVTGDKLRSAEHGNHLENLTVTFDLRFPEGEAGDQAREALPKAIERSHDRLCTVSRTVELGMPVTSKIAAD